MREKRILDVWGWRGDGYSVGGNTVRYLMGDKSNKRQVIWALMWALEWPDWKRLHPVGGT